ncbi:MAG: PQQ-binding-like beta-propeller repeat protein [Acidobacteriota bacterium]
MIHPLIPLFILLAFPCSVLGADGDWHRWRGPNNDGMAPGDAPLTWSDTKNVAWKKSIPGRGYSSPVTWGKKIFLTTAVPVATGAGTSQPPESDRGPGGGAGTGPEQELRIFCLDRITGQILWERLAKTVKPHEGYHRRYGSFASNSPVTDGQHLFASFGSLGVFCYDLNGKLIWKKDFPPARMRLQFGEGAAPVIDDERLYLKFDQERDSYLVALDKRTGNEIWRVSRDEVSSWSPPLVVTHQGARQLVVSASTKVRAYDPGTGRLLWECAGLGTNVIPAPVTAKDLVHVMSGHREPNLLTIRLGRSGDLTGTDAVVWTNERGNSYTASPVLHDNKLYFVTDSGMLSCLNALTGEPFYRQQRLPRPYNFKASPVGANGKLYLATEEGDVVVVKMGETYEVLATNTMQDQVFIASPAIAGGSLYLRSQDGLYCIRQ